MTVTSPSISTPTSAEARVSRPRSAGARRRRSCARDQRGAGKRQVLAGYVDDRGVAREVIARHAAAGSTLVIDRVRVTHEDPRLVAHLAADEPASNAALVCRCYLQDLAVRGVRCRALTVADTRMTPFVERVQPAVPQASCPAGGAQLVDRLGRVYSLEPVRGRMSIPDLRWCRRDAQALAGCQPVSLREVVAALESYEPVCALTLRELSRHGEDEDVSIALLRAELVRVQASPIVLNRRLREAVLAAIEREQLSMSEIAIRCGRIKRDRRGNEAGETSWLARRLGLLADSGSGAPTPWIHSDVLALIARQGLGISPHEVEL